MLDISKLKVPFVDIPPSSFEERKHILRQLKTMLTDNEEELCRAIHTDLHKPRLECLECEILPLKLEITNLIHNLDDWAGEKYIPRTFLSLFDTVSIQPQPLGRVLVIGAWNYPIFLSLFPFVGAIAAGNAVVLKPSELAPETESLLANLLPSYVDETVCQVFTGGAKETMQLLDTYRFDHVFYTGGMNAARSILSQVAKHLTPVTLELGGKSPVYVDASADLALTAKRLIWAKGLSAGQTCVTPDYVLCHAKVLDNFIKECISITETFYGKKMEESADFARIINERHTARLSSLLQNTRGEVVYGGKTHLEEKFIELTIVKDVKEDDVLMQEEIFGPILPIVTVQSYDEAIGYVQQKEKPLTIYVFASGSEVIEAWKNRTTSGSIVFNDCIMQLGVRNLPFGGVGNSGMGRYFGQASIDAFSNPRSLLDKSTVEKFNNLFRYPPYTESNEKWVRWGLSKGDSRCTIS
ncbi:Fatty aldehyde dehydrogenase [Echinococcus multilocularis]|uniref:Aldehyde dehydrogenase n=1 Tax=Echinococcus multilocularis TaxID=6211 RepID=A0A068Y8L2_ECHMU|nr:Fatty aldehyde dehydrogenase [Echinococcus multilocularis]